MDDREEKNKKKSKIKRLIFLIVGLFLVLTIVIGVLFYFLIKDDTRLKNVFSPTEITNEELIKKEYIDAYNNIKEDGKFRFELHDNDVNELLYNANKELNDPNIKAIYVVTYENRLNICIDMKPCIYKSRIVIDLLPSLDNDSKAVNLSILSVKMGKLPMLSHIKSKGYLTSKFVEKISELSYLPISFDESKNIFKVEPTKIASYFPTEVLSKALLDSLLTNPNSISITGLFSFSLDFNYLRSEDHKSTRVKSPLVNPLDRLNDVVTPAYLYSISPGETKEVGEFTIDEYSDYLASEMDSSLNEEYSSKYTSSSLKIYISDLYASLSVGKLKYHFNISINGFEIDACISSNVKTSTFDGVLNSLIDTSSISVGKLMFSDQYEIFNVLSLYLNDVLSALGDSYDFFSYDTSNDMVSIDFSSVGEDIIGIDSYSKYLVLDEVNLSRFIFYIGF